MVIRFAGGLVDLAADSTEGRAVEDVVNAHDEGARLEGEAEAIASLDEGVLQPIGDLTTGIGEGCVVEVTADDDTLGAVALDELVDDVRLYAMGAEGRCELCAHGVLQADGIALRGQA